MTNRRLRFIAIALTGLIALGAPVLTACGSSIENAVENAAGAAVGGDVDIDDGGVTVTDSEGNQVSVGENASIPDNWPSAVPLFEGGTLVGVTVQADGTAGGVWTTGDSPADAFAAYDSALTSAGYTQTSTASIGDGSQGVYEGNGYEVSIGALASNDETTVSISATPKS